MMNLPEKVKIVEVGGRDGLQNETSEVDLELKVSLIDRLSSCGLPAIEVGSFVSPRSVPQMAGTDLVYAAINKRPSVAYSALVPNLKGLSLAMDAGFEEIACIAAASESFSKHNINCSIRESIDRIAEIAVEALSAGMRIRGYVSCIAGCPYEGDVPIDKVVEVSQRLVELGCYEISLGDTIGVGNPLQVQKILARVVQNIPCQQIAVHFHDTYGMALANILVALQEGITVVDSSVAGLGGCPYAPGATGNVATEDVVNMLNSMGVDTGVDLEALVDTAEYISQLLGKTAESRVARAHSGRISCIST